MPTILLINDNKIVSRLLQLSSQKHDYALEEINDYAASETSYNIIFIDSEKYDQEAWDTLKSTLTYDRLGFIGDKHSAQPEGFDLLLEKPFLPTDFVQLIDENFKVMDSSDLPEELDTVEDVGDVEEEIALDLDALDEETLDSLDDLAEMETLDDTVDELDTTLTTGIAMNMIQEENSNEELASMVDEIDNMELEEEPLEEMDLDGLIDESEISSMVDDELVKESIAEVDEVLVTQEMSEDDLSELMEENNDDLSEDVSTDAIVPKLQDEPLTEKEDGVNVAAMALGGVAVAAAADTLVAEDDTLHEVTVEETLNSLDGVEAIETEDDYLKENENIVEDLADEFDSLNEVEVEKLMSGEEVLAEEVLDETFSEEEEKVVESNDLEEMITRAVAKAITKEMLQEALDDMEISIILKTKKDS